jgi:cell shape-determining protein MreC
MKMTFQIKHTKQNLFGNNSIKIIIIFLLILIFIFVFSFLSSARSLVSDILAPLFKTGNYFYGSLNEVPKFFSDRNQLIAENNKLSTEIENNYLNSVDYESIKYENQKLRETLKMKPADNFIVATIVAKSPQIPLDSLFLDRGTADGLKDGDLVLTGERILIGKIVKASKNKSTAALDSFAGVTSYGFVARTNESLEIKGVGSGSMEVKVPIDFDIMVGDKLMVSRSFTYLVAVVGVIEEDRSSGFKNVLMSLPVDISKVNTVFIEPSSNE